VRQPDRSGLDGAPRKVEAVFIQQRGLDGVQGMNDDAATGSVRVGGGSARDIRSREKSSGFNGRDVVVEVAAPDRKFFGEGVIDARQFLPAIVDIPLGVESAGDAARWEPELAVDVLDIGCRVRIE